MTTGMALRDKLNDRVIPLLEPGEQVQQVFLAQAGASPWLANGLGLLGRALFAKPRMVAVTDRAVVVLHANFNGTSPTSVLARLPRSTRIGPAKGVWAPVQLSAEKLYVHKRFHKDIEAADGALAS
jgi:hypothetical protein